MKVVSAATVRAMDATAIAAGTPGLTLMERAGEALASAILDLRQTRYAGLIDQLCIVAGRGNNGGDGFVVARLLADHLPISIFMPCQRVAFSGDARVNADRIPASVSLRTVDRLPDSALTPRTLVLDAMLGTGVTGPAREPFCSWIQQINDSDSIVVAVDLPSGLNADDGSNSDTAIKADCTITIGAPKTGLYLGDGPACAGIVRFAPIGLSIPNNAESPFETLTHPEVANHLQSLATDRHKGTMGRIRVVGGCAQYRGAPILAGSGAIRAGAGLVSIAIPAGVTPEVTPNALMITPTGLPAAQKHAPLPSDGISELANTIDVLAVGPGLGRDPETVCFVRQILALPTPLILDADALEALDATSPTFQQPVIITPHPGECARLAERLELTLPTSRTIQASSLAKRLGAVVVLKGQRTVIANPNGDISICGRGCGALATGGSGDVLAGLTAAYLHRFSQDPYLAAQIAVWVHAVASEASSLGESGFTADDLPEAIAQTVCHLSHRA